MTQDERVRLESEVVETLGSRELRLARWGHEVLWQRMQQRMLTRLEHAVRKHAMSIWREVCETGELLALMNRARTQPLTPSERRKVREQLLDLAKSVPALAIFAAPGGRLLPSPHPVQCSTAPRCGRT